MVRYAVYSTATFDRVYTTLEPAEQDWIAKIKTKLEFGSTGKILTYTWFREKKLNAKRLYFLVDDQSQRILFVAFATKKDQQATIAFVKAHMDELLTYLRRC